MIANSDRFFMVFLQYWNLSTFVRFGALLAAIFMISSLNPGPGMNSKEKLRDEIQPRGGGPVPELAALAGSTCGPCCEDREKKLGQWVHPLF